MITSTDATKLVEEAKLKALSSNDFKMNLSIVEKKIKEYAESGNTNCDISLTCEVLIRNLIIEAIKAHGFSVIREKYNTFIISWH